MDPDEKVKKNDLSIANLRSMVGHSVDSLRAAERALRKAKRTIEADCCRDVAQVLEEMKRTMQ